MSFIERELNYIRDSLDNKFPFTTQPLARVPDKGKPYIFLYVKFLKTTGRALNNWKEKKVIYYPFKYKGVKTSLCFKEQTFSKIDDPGE